MTTVNSAGRRSVKLARDSSYLHLLLLLETCWRPCCQYLTLHSEQWLTCLFSTARKTSEQSHHSGGIFLTTATNAEQLLGWKVLIWILLIISDFQYLPFTTSSKKHFLLLKYASGKFIWFSLQALLSRLFIFIFANIYMYWTLDD